MESLGCLSAHKKVPLSMNPVARFLDNLPPIFVWLLLSLLIGFAFNALAFLRGGFSESTDSPKQKMKNFLGSLGGATVFVMIISLPVLFGGGFD